jgi:Peptidase family S41
MKNIIVLMILSLLILPVAVRSQTYFQKIAGNWEGTLEYQDYSANKRVKLKTYLTIKPSSDGNSAEFITVYDDISRIIKDIETVKIDLATKKYTSGNSEYAIDSLENGKIILRGSGQDGEKVEPIRETISFDENSLVFLKETRTPWQFRNQLSLKRTTQDALTRRILSPEKLKEDFGIFKKTLVNIHPGVYRYQTPASLNKLFDEFEAKLQKPLPETDFFKLLAQFTNKINCGHTFINPYNLDGVTRERIFGGKNYLPLYFQIVGEKIIITENASPQNLAKGSEIKKINGISAKKIIETLHTVTAADGRNTLDHRIESIGLPRFEAERYALFDMYYPLLFPLQNENFVIEAVDFAMQKPITFQTSAMTKAERTAEIVKRYGKAPTYDDGWKFEIQDNSTAYLKIENSITWRLKTIKFKEFLADAFARIRAQDVKNLIIDLRGNDGGDMDIGYELAQYLAQKELPAYSEGKRFIRNISPQPDLIKYLDTYSKELKSTLENGVSPNLLKKSENNYYELLPNENVTTYPKVTPYENNFRGRAYVIADSAAASATFQFLEYAQANKLATIVGQTSGGNKQGINGGNYFFLNLPNSKAEIDIPAYYQAPLTKQQDSGIVPDILVKRQPTDIGNNLDREMLTIRKLIERE